MGRGRRATSVVGLLAAGTVAVHEVRYAVLPVPGSGPVHAYLPGLSAGAALLVLLGIALLVDAARLARRTGRAPAAAPLSFRATWALSSIALACLHVGQESVEGLVGSGLPASPLALLGQGAPVAALAALGLGAVVALALRGADAAVIRAGRRRILPLARPGRPPLPHPVPADVAVLEQAGRHLSGRGPPPLLA